MDDTSGFVVPFCDTQKMADIVIELKTSKNYQNFQSEFMKKVNTSIIITIKNI